MQTIYELAAQVRHLTAKIPRKRTPTPKLRKAQSDRLRKAWRAGKYEASKAKLSASAKAQHADPEFHAKAVGALVHAAKNKSPATIEKMRKAAIRRGRRGISEETRRKISENSLKFWAGRKAETKR